MFCFGCCCFCCRFFYFCSILPSITSLIDSSCLIQNTVPSICIHPSLLSIPPPLPSPFHPSVRLSVLNSISILPSINYPSFIPPFHPFIQLLIHVSFYPSTYYPPFHPFISLLFGSHCPINIHISTFPPVHPRFTHPFIYSIRLSFCLSSHLSFHPLISSCLIQIVPSLLFSPFNSNRSFRIFSQA